MPIRLAHHAHTGRRLPFYCTSYAVLYFIIAFTTLFLLYTSRQVVAGPPQQQSGAISLSGTIQGTPPETPAKITSPSSGSRYKQSQLEVQGNCLENAFVEIYRRNIYAGTAMCSTAGRFVIIITLLSGANELIAKTRDSLNQYGPNSDSITVYLDGTAKKSVSAANRQAPADPLLLTTTAIQKGFKLNEEATIEYEISGDRLPYIVSIDWGDGSPPGLYTHQSSGKFTASHTMKKAGQIVIHISALGASGEQAVLQTILVVEGEGSYAAPISPACTDCIVSTEIASLIDKLWLPLLIATLMTVSFWLGEKVIYQRLKAI